MDLHRTLLLVLCVLWNMFTGSSPSNECPSNVGCELVGTCLQSCCLAKRSSNPVEYYHCMIENYKYTNTKLQKRKNYAFLLEVQYRK
jgi:hypothetical protein